MIHQVVHLKFITYCIITEKVKSISGVPIPHFYKYKMPWYSDTSNGTGIYELFLVIIY